MIGRTTFFIVSAFFLVNCRNGNKAKVSAGMAAANTQTMVTDSVPDVNLYNGEMFKIQDTTLNLVATKRKTSVKNVGEVCLKYSFKGQTDTSNFCFPYPEFSDVIFADSAVAIMNNNRFRLSDYYLFKDNKLLMPLIGMNFLLVYVIDLKAQRILQERRTHIEFIWVNEKTGTFLATDSPQMSGQQINVSYNAFVYNIRATEVALLKEGRITFSTDEVRDAQLEFKMVKRLLDK